MKKNLHIVLCTLAMMAGFLSSCETEAPYITDGTELTFEVLSVMGTQFTIKATPKDDRAYYYFNIVPRSEWDTYKIEDKRLMTLALDQLYQDYLNWRFDHLKADEEYITDFRSHTFNYGVAQKTFTNLQPKTEYVIMGFCINPVNIQKPVGKLFTKIVSTTDLRTDVSPMVIDFKIDIEDTPDEYDLYKMRVTARPSNDSMPTVEPYIFSYIPERLLDEYFGGSILNYCDSVMVYLLAGEDDQKAWISHDIASEVIDIETGQAYWIVGAAYSLAYHQSLFTRHFVAEPGLHLPYGHDERTNYAQDDENKATKQDE